MRGQLTRRSMLAGAVLCAGCGPEVGPQVGRVASTDDEPKTQVDTPEFVTDSQPDTPITLPDGHHLFLRITKGRRPEDRDGVLEAFSGPPDGTFTPLAAWPICTWSGAQGPKLREGDGQSPEGFYAVGPGAMNPNSAYHLSFNLGFPNAYDRAHGRTGSYLMVHGDCVSIGCYAMTDPGIEAIYALVEAAFAHGQPFVRVHAFPFPMTPDNLAQIADHPDRAFWANLAEGWVWFEANGRPPDVGVEGRGSGSRYAFSAS